MVQIYVFIDFNCLFCLLLFALSVLFFKQHKVSNLFFFPFGIIVFFDVFVGFAL
ncbi:putative membrane protein [Escherichia coli MP020940.1]|nr:putative membrane protein [Escherichia coli MP021552.12]EMU70857.1 putative membrane protein [Escherichia coli MP021552.11]EMU72659.1 putative membrane protein [Escherichia coli MP021552.7]EMV28217.1 putative membrane protein [Escherichia coli C-34666]EMV83511.1 putative membrane protein [Escherichia coli 2865200]EMW37294.1 putative membrane protein [Escherichia coli 2788150]EMW39118.1 putative membrane protein [Escherichia coli 2785200]EMW42521.1 putative membrane protein [Escherichia co